MFSRKQLYLILVNFLVVAQLIAVQAGVAIGQSTDAPVELLERATPIQTEKQIRQSLESVKKLDSHPLYEMRYVGDYDAQANLFSQIPESPAGTRWACSIFVAFGTDGTAHYGRNFDWQNNPALLLHTNPSNGFASISMVDVSYLGYSRNDDKFDSIEGRKALLRAPFLPFDGMNEHGLTVGMAAVGDTQIPNDPDKPTVGSLQIIRLMLDRCKTVNEALELMEKFNVVGVGGPLIHYLIADADGKSALIEQKDGKRNVIRNDKNWQSATNFYLTGEKHPLNQCQRYAKIHQQMSDSSGTLSVDQTFKLLKNVAQRSTRWSVVYDLKNASAHVAMSRRFNKRYQFSAKPELANVGTSNDDQ